MRTQNDASTAPYVTFGAQLARWRQQAGISRQADFASRVKTKQQSVSRWEKGQSRPREKQLPLIASVLGVPLNEVQAAAGYGTKTVVASFDQPFPVDALAPEPFERFCASLIQRLYPAAKVHRAGKSGHSQDGTDIIAESESGAVLSFQCKRVEEFGPQKVHAAVALHTINAAQKFLVLSRVASPQARQAIREHRRWDIWDKDDLSAKIRSLSKIDQRALVDIFFAGQRFALLGEAEEGVWETTKEFFAPFENSLGLFNHTWALVGRKDSLDKFVENLEKSTAKIVLLVGPGGSGKSRVLKQAIEIYEKKNKNIIVRFLSRTTELSKKSLEELGNRRALLVVDDAHDRSDLPLLFQFVATTDRVRVVLALRPYGLNQIKSQASHFSLIETVVDVVLQPLSKTDAEELAKQVLRKEKGPLSAAKDIAQLTYDCPLATVVGSQIVAREKKVYDLTKNGALFRSTLFGRFADVIAGEIGHRSEAGQMKRLLRVLALFQPFYPDDKLLLALIENIEGIAPHDTSRLLKQLIDGGVLFKRGGRFRLSPDVLADYIIEDTCVGPAGKSTGYAEKAFAAADNRQIQALLLNLGKLDWQLSNGDASNSHLLDGVWSMLSPQSEYSDPHIQAVEATAFYQPLRAMDFAEKLIRGGQFTNQLSEIFKYAAFNIDHLSRACAALWHLGRDDDRELHQHPAHPIRILAELCEVQPNKPLAYNEVVIKFALDLARNAEAWSHRYTPFHILAAIFKTEGHTTTAKNNTMVFNPYTITPSAVLPLRQRVLDLIFELLGSKNIRIATRAARTLEEALRGPMGQFNLVVAKELRDEWTKIFCDTLKQIEKSLLKGQYDPLVLSEIAKAISWHVTYSESETKKYAKRAADALSTSLDYRVISALADGYQTQFVRPDLDNYEAQIRAYHERLTADVLAAHPNGADLREYIAKQLEHIKKAQKQPGSPFVLYSTLLQQSPSLVHATIADAFDHPDSPTAQFVADALNLLWRSDVQEGRKTAVAFLATGHNALMIAVGRALATLDYKSQKFGKLEYDLIRRIVTSDNESLISTGIYAIRFLASANRDEAFALAKQVNVLESHRLADELLCLFTFGAELPFSRLSGEDVERFLAKLLPVRELRGHWTETFLAAASKMYPDETLNFLFKRVDISVKRDDWKYRPVNFGPYIHVPLRFKEHAQYGALLTRVAAWMRSTSFGEKEKDFKFRYRSRELFEAAFGSFDAEVLHFVSRWSETADKEGFELIANILREAPHTFVFEHAQLVMSLLAKAQRIGSETLQGLQSALFQSSIRGLRSGTPGEPFERDVVAKRESEKILEGLSKLSPQFELYSEILKSAEAEIARQLSEREAFED